MNIYIYIYPAILTLDPGNTLRRSPKKVSFKYKHYLWNYILTISG